VGVDPTSIAIRKSISLKAPDTIYLANSRSDSVSVIDAISNKVVTGSYI
jgi:hypothetical protein